MPYKRLHQSYSALETNNPVNKREGGYENVSEYIPVEQPNSSTIAKLDELRASEDSIGDRELKALMIATEPIIHVAHPSHGRPHRRRPNAGRSPSVKEDLDTENHDRHRRRVANGTRGLGSDRAEDKRAGGPVGSGVCAFLPFRLALHLACTHCIFSGVDFDSEEYGYHQENKSHVKVSPTISPNNNTYEAPHVHQLP